MRDPLLLVRFFVTLHLHPATFGCILLGPFETLRVSASAGLIPQI